MIRHIAEWWKRRGVRACAEDRCAWKSCEAPLEKMGTGNAFAVNFGISMLYDWATCRRCGKMGRRPRDC